MTHSVSLTSSRFSHCSGPKSVYSPLARIALLSITLVLVLLLSELTSHGQIVTTQAPSATNSATSLTAAPVAKKDKLLLVAPKSLSAGLAEFINFKSKFRPVELVDLEKILESTDGVDSPEKLKRFLYDQWLNADVGFVLLVGDVSHMPVRYMVLDRVTPAAFDYSFYPSDLYYGDLAKADGAFEDWNGQKEGFHAGYFGEVRGEKNKEDPINFDSIDYRPEIAVGRWPVETLEEVECIAKKTIEYETQVRSKDHSTLQRAALISVGGWVDTRGLFDSLAGQLEPGWQIEKRYYSDAARPSTSIPNHASVRKLLNDGIGLAIHAGHGQPDGWEQCLSVSDLEKISNAGRMPIIVSAGCSTAYFAPLAPYGPYVDIHGVEHKGTDAGELFTEPPPPPAPIQTGKFNPTGLGEIFLKRSENGSVAYIGCNTGSQPCGLTLVKGFVGHLSTDAQPHLGECWNEAVRRYFVDEHLDTLKPNRDWYPPSIFFQSMKFMMFGDPSLPLPSNQPS